MLRKINRKGQQEIAGFVLIVVLVVVALMIFLIITLKKPQTEVKSRQADDLLYSLMKYTTECVVSPPYTQTMEDLVKSCYNNRKCDNLNLMACEYLNESVAFILADVANKEATINGFEVLGIHVFDTASGGSESRLFQVVRGSCNSNSTIIGGGPYLIGTDDGRIDVYLKLCSSNN